MFHAEFISALYIPRYTERLSRDGLCLLRAHAQALVRYTGTGQRGMDTGTNS